MPKSPPSNIHEQAADQFGRFVETARALNCGEDKERFEEALGKIARHKPPTKTQMKSKKMKKPAT
jgi:hypothetical protein